MFPFCETRHLLTRKIFIQNKSMPDLVFVMVIKVQNTCAVWKETFACILYIDVRVGRCSHHSCSHRTCVVIVHFGRHMGEACEVTKSLVKVINSIII